MLLVRMCWVVCLFIIACMFVCLFVLQAIKAIGCREGGIHGCYLKSYGFFYFSNVWWDHIPVANCSWVNGELCSCLVAPNGYVMASVF